jgi:predicted AAA+ superfamily ATPase
VVDERIGSRDRLSRTGAPVDSVYSLDKCRMKPAQSMSGQLNSACWIIQQQLLKGISRGSCRRRRCGSVTHRYLNLLETSYQIVRLEPYSVNRTKRLIKTPKLYWNDPALALHLGHSGGEAEPSGAHFENLVFCDLLAWRDMHVPRASVTYWRTAAGHEVDFVLERQRQLPGVEVKAGPHPTMTDVRGSRAFLEEYPRSARGAIVLHGGDESYWLNEKIIAVQWWRVM